MGNSVLPDDGVLHGPECGGTSRYSDFVVDVLNVVIGGFRGDEELVGDLLRRESSCGEAQDTQPRSRLPHRGRLL
jgi:hypothetical protein